MFIQAMKNIYVEEPKGFVVPRSENKVYKLQKKIFMDLYVDDFLVIGIIISYNKN